MPTWPLNPAAAPSTSADGLVVPGQPKFLGRGILSPFRRDQKNDFANGEGADLVGANVEQVLGTKRKRPGAAGGGGEIPWRPEMGSLMHLVRHRGSNFVLGEMLRVYVIDAVGTWEPRARITGVTPVTVDRTIRIQVTFDVVDRNDNTIAKDQTVELPLLS